MFSGINIKIKLSKDHTMTIDARIVCVESSF